MRWRVESRTQRDWLAALGLAVLIFFEWTAAYRFFVDQRWTDPLSYRADAQYTAGVVAAAARGDFLPFFSKDIPSLGAPFVASWNDFPMTEDPLYFLVGLAARRLGLFGAINVGLLAAALLAGWSLFFVARRLHLGRPFAFMGALLFALAPYAFYRSVHHYSLTFYFVAPWQILLCTWLASRKGLSFGSRRFVAATVIAIGSAWSMVYYLFFALHLWALGLIAHRLRRGKEANVRPGLAILGIALAAGLAVNLDSLVFLANHGLNRFAFSRGQSGVEQYALKAVDLLVPGAEHRFAAGRFVANSAARTRITSGEAPSPYLGVVGALSLLAMLGYAASAVIRRRVDLPATWGLTALWLVFFHSVGGGVSLLGVMEVTVFRSVNRVSIVVFAYVLLFTAWLLPRRLRSLSARARWALAVGLGVLGSWEAIPVVSTAESVAEARRLAESDRRLVESAEVALPFGARVFQLPAVDFPEGGAPGLESYEMFRPYYFARHLRFSFGDVKGRPNANWKFSVVSRPFPELVAELRKNGFEAIFVNFKAYENGPAIVEQLRTAGATVIAIADEQDSAFLRLPQ